VWWWWLSHLAQNRTQWQAVTLCTWLSGYYVLKKDFIAWKFYYNYLLMVMLAPYVIMSFLSLQVSATLPSVLSADPGLPLIHTTLLQSVSVVVNAWGKSVLIHRWHNNTSEFHIAWLQIQRSGFDSRCYQIFREVVGLERGTLSLVSTIEELLERKSSGSCLENREYGRRDPSRWRHRTFCPQKSALTSPVARSVYFARELRPRSWGL
jgi:hypothetical protein